jgi:hypothetical protein
MRCPAAYFLEAAGDVELDEFPDQQHSFQLAAGLALEADDAISRFAAWARPKLLG